MKIQGRDCDSEEFRELLEGAALPDKAIVLAWAEQWEMLETVGDLAGDFTELVRMSEGLIFWREGELRFRRLANGVWRVLAMGDLEIRGADSLNSELGLPETEIERRTESRLLWGQRTSRDLRFIERQMPRPFKYPVEGTLTGRMALRVELWCDKESGEVIFERAMALEVA